LTAWNNWTSPSKKGITFREREIVRDQKNGGKECGPGKQSKAGKNCYT
jgi:hypothetical protein